MTPPALASQWVDELALHSPSLKVFVYDGWSKLETPITENDVEWERANRKTGGKVKYQNGVKVSDKPKKGKAKGKAGDDDDYMDVDSPAASHEDGGDDLVDWCTFINRFDVCITTYNTLRHDISVARPPPVRPRREDVV